MAITSPEGICGFAVSVELGSKATISSISQPRNAVEIECARVYDITRQVTLKREMPNFSLLRDVLALAANVTPKFGYAYAYRYPANCLKLLGINNIEDKIDQHFTVEGGYIYTDQYDGTTGLPVRFIADITDVTAMSPEFIILLAKEIAANLALPVTQSLQKKQAVTAALPGARQDTSAMNAQENPPIRFSRSRFRAARSSVCTNTNWKK